MGSAGPGVATRLGFRQLDAASDIGLPRTTAGLGPPAASGFRGWRMELERFRRAERKRIGITATRVVAAETSGDRAPLTG